MNKNRFSAALLAANLLLTLPAAAPAQEPHPAPPPPLKPGHSAGVQRAQQARTGLALIGGGAVIAVVIVAATAGSNGSGSNNPVNPQVSPATTS